MPGGISTKWIFEDVHCGVYLSFYDLHGHASCRYGRCIHIPNERHPDFAIELAYRMREPILSWPRSLPPQGYNFRGSSQSHRPLSGRQKTAMFIKLFPVLEVVVVGGVAKQ